MMRRFRQVRQINPQYQSHQYQQYHNQYQQNNYYLLHLSSLWFRNIVNALEQYFKLTPDSSTRIRKRTYKDISSNRFAFTLSGFFVSPNGEKTFVYGVHWQLPAPANSPMTYLRFIKDGRIAKEVLIEWSKEIPPTVLQVKEIS